MFVVHDVGYLVTQDFWIDESWVAVSTRAPLGSLPWITSSTPLGWTLLLRLVPAGGEAIRVIPLLFSAAAVVAAWWFGREVPLPRFTPVLTGLAVLLVPAMLVREDLKQYTAEACAAVVLLVLVARLEAQWSRRRLAAIVIFTMAAMLFANAVVFVGAAAVGALALEPVVRRDWHRLREVAIAGLAMFGLCAAVYAAVDARNVHPALSSYWAVDYVPRNHGVHGVVTFLYTKASALAPFVGLKFLAVDALMMVIGIVVLIRVRRYAVAAMVPLTILLVIAASAARKYPFGDRTSKFWLVMSTVLVAIGAAGLIEGVRRKVGPPAAYGALAAVIALWVVAVHPYVRSHTIPRADVRSQVRYVEAHRRAADVVIVDWGAAWAFAFYDHSVTPSFRHDDQVPMGFMPAYPHTPWILQMTGRKPPDVTAVLSTALTRLGGQHGRIWIVRSQLFAAERRAWNLLLAGKAVRTIRVGPQPLLLYEPAR